MTDYSFTEPTHVYVTEVTTLLRVSAELRHFQRVCTIFIIIIIIIIIITIIITGIQPLGRFGQRPELSQANGMTLVLCILDKFLG